MKNPKYPETARRLKLAMEEKGIKAVELSQRTGINKSSISQYMSGSHWPDDNRKVGKIAEVLGVNPTWLMGLDVPMYKIDEFTGHYLNEETAQVAQEIFDDSYLHALFDAARDSKPEDLMMAADLLRRLKGTNPDG